MGLGLAVLPAWWLLQRVASGGKGDWHTDTAPLEQAFPLLGPLSDAKWVSSRDNDRGGIPSPELVISGFARLAPGKLAELTAAHTFVSEGPTDDFSSWFEKSLKGEGRRTRSGSGRGSWTATAAATPPTCGSIAAATPPASVHSTRTARARTHPLPYLSKFNRFPS